MAERAQLVARLVHRREEGEHGAGGQQRTQRVDVRIGHIARAQSVAQPGRRADEGWARQRTHAGRKRLAAAGRGEDARQHGRLGAAGPRKTHNDAVGPSPPDACAARAAVERYHVLRRAGRRGNR